MLDQNYQEIAEINQNVKSIHRWVRFFGIMYVVSMVAVIFIVIANVALVGALLP
jgi:cell division protein FtsX